VTRQYPAHIDAFTYMHAKRLPPGGFVQVRLEEMTAGERGSN